MGSHANTPFGKLFRTPQSYYIYDAPHSEILEIGQETYDYIDALQRGAAVESVPPEVITLLEQGYLKSDSPVRKIEHPYTSIVETLLARKLSLMTLQLTQQCNFRCKYCIYSDSHNVRQRSHSDLSMSWDTAKKAVDFLWEHSVDSDSVSIAFYGGEPLLQLDLIQEIIAYAGKRFKGKHLQYAMTCNGSLLSKEAVKLLVENNVRLMVSMDGPKSIHDKNRVFPDGSGTFDVVIKNLKYIKKAYPKYWKQTMISMVVDPQSDFDEVNKICHERGIYPRNIMPSILDCEFDDVMVHASADYIERQEYHRFLSYLAYWGRYPKKHTSPLIERAVMSEKARFADLSKFAPLSDSDIPSGPCIPGQMRLFVDVNGKLFPCERVSETSSVMCIGDIDNGFQIEQVKKLLNSAAVSAENCKHCWCFRLCSQCVKAADDGDKLSAAKKLKHCEETRHDAHARLGSYLLFNEISQRYSSLFGEMDMDGE